MRRKFTDRHHCYSKVFYGLVALCVFAAMFCGGAAWAATSYDLANVEYVLLNDAATQSPATITGTRNTGVGYDPYALIVWIQDGFSGGTVILEDVSIDLFSNTEAAKGPIYVGSSGTSSVDVTILLSGDNYLRAGENQLRAGLQIIGPDISVAFDSAVSPGSSEGKLEAVGSGITNQGAGAGIGGGNEESGGKITINGGTIVATGGRGDGAGSLGSGSGIGGGSKGDGTVTIFGGTVVADGGDGYRCGSGIGGGAEGNGTVTIYGGSIVATGATSGHADANFGGSGIGGGGGNSGTGRKGTVTISGGIVVATAGTGGNNPAKDIGGGGGGGATAAGTGTATITGGSVQATTVDSPKNANNTSVKCDAATNYDATNKGKTISFTVTDSTNYPYTFTVPENGNAYLWLPGGTTAPDVGDVNDLGSLNLNLNPKYENSICFFDLSMSSVSTPIIAWKRLLPGSLVWSDGTDVPDDNGGAGFTTAGLYSYKAHAGSAALSIWGDPATATLTAPAITNTTVILSVKADETGTLTAEATGTPTPEFSATLQSGDVLPNWITIGASSGVITATPSATETVGDTVIRVTATNGVTPAASEDFTITVTGIAPSFTQTPVISPDATFGENYGTETFTFVASGNPDPVLSMGHIDDKLGMTISFAPDTGELTISGTPTNSGAVTGTITADNGITPAATTDFTLTVKGTTPRFTQAPLNIQDVTFGEDYGTHTFTFPTDGNPAPVLSMDQIADADKLGLTITFDPVTGVLTIEGTPTDSGTITGTITAINSFGSDSQNFTITVKGTSPSITQTPASISDATVSADYGTQTFTFTADGNPAPTLSMDQIDEADKLGLTITFDPDNGELTISGTPTDSGTVTGRITATNSVDSVSKDFTLTVRGIAPGITQTPAGIPDATVSTDYGTRTFTFTASGNPAPTLSMDQIDEDDKLGLTIDFVDATGVLTISGTPTASGTVTGTVGAKNNAGTATKAWTLAVLPEPTPGTPLDDAKDSFNNNNPNSGLTVDFPTETINDTLEVRSQLDGLTPVILGNASVSSVTLALSDASSQSAADELSSLGKGWGAKIKVELRVAPVAGQILLLPVALTFVLTEADLAEVGLTADGAAGDPASLLAASLFAKFPIEGADKDTLLDFTNLLNGILTVTKTADGGVSIGFSFLLANGAGKPRVVVDGASRHLVIFDGESNGWLRDPIFIFRRTIVPVEIALTPTPDPLALEEGETGTIAATFTPADTTERDLVWTVDPADIAKVAKVAKAASADTWTVTALTAGTATLTATADGGATATLPLTVTESHESGGGVGCDAGFGALLLLTLGLAVIRRQR